MGHDQPESSHSGCQARCMQCPSVRNAVCIASIVRWCIASKREHPYGEIDVAHDEVECQAMDTAQKGYFGCQDFLRQGCSIPFALHASLK